VEDRALIQTLFVGSVRPGTQLNRVYEIEGLIANGGMGEVYRGFNIVTHDPVAIKLIRPEFASDPEIFELFRREASVLHNLPNEAIVRYFVFSIDPDLRRAYLAMEFVDGPSLTDRFAAGPMALENVTILQQRIASALDVAHRHGVVHRDISPDNVRYLGLGRTPGPFERFDSGYQAAVGAEAAIRTPEQRPALDLLRVKSAGGTAEPLLEIKEQNIGHGAPLAGTISNRAGRRLYPLLIDDDGVIHRLATAAQPGGGMATFSVAIQPQGSFLNAYQLLVAVASPTPIPVLEAIHTGPLRPIAGRLVEEARRASASAVADYFKFVN
jgi:hypothetical protein